MAHAIWSGAINFGLVTIPVKLFTAVKTDDLSFNLLHKTDEGRIKYDRVCSVDGKPVPWDEIVKGYEYEKGQYVLLTDDDFAKVNPEATQSVDIVEFVELSLQHGPGHGRRIECDRTGHHECRECIAKGRQHRRAAAKQVTDLGKA